MENKYFLEALNIWLKNNEDRIEPDFEDMVIIPRENDCIFINNSQLDEVNNLEIKIRCKYDIEFKKVEETKANIEAWDDLQADSFHLDLIKYKTTHSNNDFNKIWTELKKINKQMANKYIKTLPMKARQIFLSETNSKDYSEFLTELLIKAIEAWNPDKHLKFKTF